MKRVTGFLFCLCGIILLLLLLNLPESPTQTGVGTVVDLAMSEGMSYVGVEFDDGTGACLYEDAGKPELSANLLIGDRVEVTYAIRSTDTDRRYSLIAVKKLS